MPPIGWGVLEVLPRAEMIARQNLNRNPSIEIMSFRTALRMAFVQLRIKTVQGPQGG